MAQQTTTAQIRQLRSEAYAAGDEAQVAVCDRALAGDDEARAECAHVAQDALAQDDSPRGLARWMLSLRPEQLPSCAILPPYDDDGIDAWAVLRAVASDGAAEHAGLRLRFSWEVGEVGGERRSRVIVVPAAAAQGADVD